MLDRQISTQRSGKILLRARQLKVQRRMTASRQLGRSQNSQTTLDQLYKDLWVVYKKLDCRRLCTGKCSGACRPERSAPPIPPAAVYPWVHAFVWNNDSAIELLVLPHITVGGILELLDKWIGDHFGLLSNTPVLVLGSNTLLGNDTVVSTFCNRARAVHLNLRLARATPVP